MLRKVREIGTKTRACFFWMNMITTTCLVVDNAGGHGVILAIETYAKTSLDGFNIEMIHQVRNSPETNLLHLRVWAALQSSVERSSRRQRQDPDVLNDAVLNAWKTCLLKQLGKFLDLVLK